MPLLEFNCRLGYPSGFQIDIRFITEGGVAALVGPSGSGKTSVLSMIAGLRTPDAGAIRLGQRVLFDSQAGVNLPPEARHIGYVFQDHLLFPHLSVRRNLQYGRRRRTAEARAVDFARVTQVLELADLLERMPHTLSGGQRQRVALGRALLYGPELLLLDEPLASVDDELKLRVLDYIEQVQQEWHIPMLYVTHNGEEVRRLAQQVIEIRKGRVVNTI